MHAQPTRQILDILLHALARSKVDKVLRTRLKHKIPLITPINPNYTIPHPLSRHLRRQMTQSATSAQDSDPLATERLLLRSALKTVTPAHSSGAAASELSLSGMGVTYVAWLVTYC